MVAILISVILMVYSLYNDQYLLQVAVKTLPFYKEFFGISYPLPKMDLIAIADFAAGILNDLDIN